MGEWNAVHGMYVVRKNKKSWATDWVAAQWQFGDDVGIVWANYSIIHSDGVVSKPWLSNAQGIWHEYVVDFKCIGESRQRCSIHPHATATCYMDLRKECWCVSMGVTMVRNHIPFHVASFFMCHSTPPNLLQMSTASPWEALRHTCFVLRRFEEFEYLQVNSNSLLSPGFLGGAIRLWCSATACWSADAWECRSEQGCDITSVTWKNGLRGWSNLSEWQFHNRGNIYHHF